MVETVVTSPAPPFAAGKSPETSAVARAPAVVDEPEPTNRDEVRVSETCVSVSPLPTLAAGSVPATSAVARSIAVVVDPDPTNNEAVRVSLTCASVAEPERFENAGCAHSPTPEASTPRAKLLPEQFAPFAASALAVVAFPVRAPTNVVAGNVPPPLIFPPPIAMFVALHVHVAVALPWESVARSVSAARLSFV